MFPINLKIKEPTWTSLLFINTLEMSYQQKASEELLSLLSRVKRRVFTFWTKIFDSFLACVQYDKNSIQYWLPHNKQSIFIHLSASTYLYIHSIGNDKNEEKNLEKHTSVTNSPNQYINYRKDNYAKVPQGISFFFLLVSIKRTHRNWKQYQPSFCHLEIA